ncbi:MAG: hypothetical protein QM783_16625 [Phycisphaerales bacterium]
MTSSITNPTRTLRSAVARLVACVAAVSVSAAVRAAAAGRPWCDAL